MWSVLRIFLTERGEADFASDCTGIAAYSRDAKV
jgi:hypothetical protein